MRLNDAEDAELEPIAKRKAPHFLLVRSRSFPDQLLYHYSLRAGTQSLVLNEEPHRDTGKTVQLYGEKIKVL